MTGNGKQRVTDRKVKSLKPRDKRYDEWFEGGLGVRIGTSGKLTWMTMLRVGGKQRRIFLGTYPGVGVAKANRLCAAAREAAATGKDPALVAEGGAPRAPKPDTDNLTVSALIDDYLRLYARPNKRTADQDEAILNREIRPRWGNRIATDIGRRDVIAVLDEIVARGAPVAANRTLGIVRRMFSWAVSRDRLPASPCVAVERPVKEIARDRALTPGEIKLFWTGLDNTAIGPVLRHALKLLLVSGQRRSEVLQATWGEFDFETGWWEIPAWRAKNNRVHRVPLNDLALQLLNEVDVMVRAAGITNDRVFINTRIKKPLAPASPSVAMLSSLDALGLADAPATPHDLRRSMATRLGELAIPRLIVGKLLNHTEAGITRIYDRFEYADEKAKAMAAWGERLKEIVSGKPKPANVVPVRDMQATE